MKLKIKPRNAWVKWAREGGECGTRKDYVEICRNSGGAHKSWRKPRHTKKNPPYYDRGW